MGTFFKECVVKEVRKRRQGFDIFPEGNERKEGKEAGMRQKIRIFFLDGSVCLGVQLGGGGKGGF